MLEVFDILEIFGRILNTLLRLTLHKLEVNVAIFSEQLYIGPVTEANLDPSRASMNKPFL